MRNRILALGLLFLIVLSLNGCKKDTPLPNSDTASEVPATSFLDSKKETTDNPPKPETEDVSQVDSEIKPTEEKTEVQKHSIDTVSTTAPTVKEKPQTDAAENKTEPTQPISENTEKQSPKESKPTEPTPIPPAKEEKSQETQKPEPIKEPEFDINYWTSFATEYAQSIGLSLDNTAVECWDNPISANAKRTNIKADIISRLNRYKNLEGFTAVWIWAEKVSATDYQIYIGYA